MTPPSTPPSPSFLPTTTLRSISVFVMYFPLVLSVLPFSTLRDSSCTPSSSLTSSPHTPMSSTSSSLVISPTMPAALMTSLPSLYLSTSSSITTAAASSPSTTPPSVASTSSLILTSTSLVSSTPSSLVSRSPTPLLFLQTLFNLPLPFVRPSPFLSPMAFVFLSLNPGPSLLVRFLAAPLLRSHFLTPIMMKMMMPPRETIIVFVAYGRFHFEDFMIPSLTIKSYRYDLYLGKLFLEEYNH